MASQLPKSWHESNSLWGSVSLVIAVLIAVVSSMRRDNRWLLPLAWFPFCFALWRLSAYLTTSKGIRRLATLVFGLIAIGCLWRLSDWLRPENAVTAQQHEKEIVEQHETVAQLTTQKAPPANPARHVASGAVTQRVARGDSELRHIQADATSLINRMTDTLVETFKYMYLWLGHPQSNGRQFELSVLRSDFDTKYNRNYKDEVARIHRELMGHITNVPQPIHGPSRERIYDPVMDSHGRAISAYDVEDQLLDLCVLLLQMERENGLPATCSVNDLQAKVMPPRQ